MGINPRAAEIEREILEKIKLSYLDLKVCELGNQIWLGQFPAKLKYKELGVANHVSFDLNGCDGSLKIDLNKPIPEEFKGEFDLVTDYGTIEHVNNQFMVFKNMHDLCKINGVMIHALPKKGHWPNHGRYYYTEEFFKELSKLANYQIVILRTEPCYSHIKDEDLIHVAIIKLQEDFINKSEFNKLNIYDSGDLSHTGDYTK